jgi:hypothetical protein
MLDPDRRGQDAQCRCLFKATDHTPSRTPSIGLMPDLAIEPERHGLLVLHVRVRALQHPSRPPASMPFLCRGRSRRTALPCSTLMRLAAHLGIAGKMPLTDFCNRHFRHEHPTPIARLPSPQLSPRRPRPPSEPQPFGPEPLREHGVGPSLRPARFRSRGRAIQPRVKQRLTALPKLQPALPILPLVEVNRARPRAIPTSATAFSAMALAEDQTSDAPVAPRDSPSCPGFSRRA